MSQPAYEKSDVTIGGIASFAAVLVVATALIMAFIVWLYWGFEDRAAQVDASSRPKSQLRQALPDHPPEPILQGSPGSNFELQHPMVEMEEWDLTMDEYLAGSGWVDQNEGVVRIPIEDAKRLLLDRGLPVREEGQ